MSKAKTSSTEVKADGSNKKAADTIKVVTVVLLKPTHSMPLLLDGLSLFGPDDFKQHCFIKRSSRQPHFGTVHASCNGGYEKKITNVYL